MGTCAYTAGAAGRRGIKGGRACGNEAHKDGMCKFHLDGYLDEGTADEVRDLFWRMHDAAPGDPMDCTGYALPPLVREGETASVVRALRLDRARFTLGGAGRITFKEPVSFRSAKFAGNASFRGCAFRKDADFFRAVFRGGAADFKSARFGGAADFFHADFERAAFDWAVLGKSRFNKAVFRGDASFYDVAFGSPAEFHSVRFLGEAKFEEVKFGEGANFGECTFKKGADFSQAAFRGGAADFKSAKFGGTADFFHADFEEAAFDRAALGKSRFNKAVFRGDASFRGAAFGEPTAEVPASESRFEESEFREGADFSGANFSQPMYFRGVVTKCPKLIRFDGNVSNVSFLNTDLKEVGFGSMITWLPQTSRGSRAIWDRKCRIYDEKILESENPDPALNLENVRSVYRDLRDNFDQQLRYDVAGGFFVREMELGRKYRIDEGGRAVPKPICRRVLTWHTAYNVLAEYGQSLGRPSLFLALTLAAGSLLLWCDTEILRGLRIPCEDGLGDSIFRTLTAMVPLPLPGHLASPADIVLKITALPAVATLLIALRRRFEKTRRH